MATNDNEVKGPARYRIMKTMLALLCLPSDGNTTIHQEGLTTGKWAWKSAIGGVWISFLKPNWPTWTNPLGSSRSLPCCMFWMTCVTFKCHVLDLEKLNFGGHRYGDAVDCFSKPVANFELELLRALCALATAALNCSGRSKFSTGLQRRPYVRSNLSSCLLKKEQALKFLMWCEINVLKDFQDVLVWCIMCACIFLGGANAPNIIPASPQVKRRGLVLAFWWRSKQHLSYFCDIYILKDFQDVLAWLEHWCVHILGWSKWPKYHPCIFTREKKRSFPRWANSKLRMNYPGLLPR